MKKIDYIRNSVEEKIKRHLNDTEYSIAYAKSCRFDCSSMQDRIDAIVRCLR